MLRTGLFKHFGAAVGLMAVMVLAGCSAAAPAATATPAPLIASPTAIPSAVVIPSPSALSSPNTITATRVGANFVLSLPRDNAVPVDWAMDRTPGYRTFERQAGETYKFACLEVPARSLGVASVGYRHLDGLPNVYIEYVVYASAEEAALALADMQTASETCAEFTLGSGTATTAAAMAPIDFRSFGDDSFAAALSTTNQTTGDLVTHLLKIRQNRVVIGIHHAGAAESGPPDSSLTEYLAGLAVENLAAVE